MTYTESELERAAKILDEEYGDPHDPYSIVYSRWSINFQRERPQVKAALKKAKNRK